MSDHVLINPQISGLYHLNSSRYAALEASAARIGFSLLKADIAAYSSTEEVLRRLGAIFNFPTWYGANFDALFDCLTDPDWQPAKGYLLLITGIARLRLTNPEDFATLIEVFQAVADAWRGRNIPCWILIDTPARGIPLFPEA